MRVTCSITIDLPLAGETFEPDWQCGSVLWAEGLTPKLGRVSYGDGERYPVPSSFVWPEFAAGQTLGIGIPSGEFHGTIDHVEAVDDQGRVVHPGDEHAPVAGQRVWTTGVWDGKDAGLLGGMSAFGGWTVHVRPDAMVETSLCSGSLRWDVYRAARALVEGWYVEEAELPADLTAEERTAVCHFRPEPEEQRERLRLAVGCVLTLREGLRDQTVAAALAWQRAAQQAFEAEGDGR